MREMREELLASVKQQTDAFFQRRQEEADHRKSLEKQKHETIEFVVDALRLIQENFVAALTPHYTQITIGSFKIEAITPDNDKSEVLFDYIADGDWLQPRQHHSFRVGVGTETLHLKVNGARVSLKPSLHLGKDTNIIAVSGWILRHIEAMAHDFKPPEALISSGLGELEGPTTVNSEPLYVLRHKTIPGPIYLAELGPIGRCTLHLSEALWKTADEWHVILREVHDRDKYFVVVRP